MNEELKANLAAVLELLSYIKKPLPADELYSRIRQIEIMLKEDILPAVTKRVVTAGVDVQRDQTLISVALHSAEAA